MQIVRITNKIEGYDDHGMKKLYPVSANSSDETLDAIKTKKAHFISISKSNSYPGFYELSYIDRFGETKHIIVELKCDIVDLLFGDDDAK